MSPAIQARRVVLCGVPAVAQVPDEPAGVAAVEQAADGVGDEQTVDQAGGLLARVGVNRVELGGHDLHTGGLAAQGRLEQALVIGMARGPVQDTTRVRNSVQQECRVTLMPRPLHVAVVGDEAGDKADGLPLGQHVLRPVVVAGPWVAAVDADADAGVDLLRITGKGVGECSVSGRVTLSAGADAAGA